MLELRNITKRFGTVLANDHVNITARAGTIHAIVGENGAGKSTAMRIAYGFYTADEGEVVVDGSLGMVHQHFMLVEPMTVTENIVLGAEPGSSLALDIAGAAQRVKALSEEFHLEIPPDAVIENLSVGQQQRVELLKALYREARILILDEPTAVLTPHEVAEFFNILRRMRAQGKTVILITHKLDEVLAISDEVTVMRDGRVVGHRKTHETNAAELARLMVGRDVLLRVEKTPARPFLDDRSEPVLRVKDLSMRAADGVQRLASISFDVRAGEIVGIAGVEGNGQTELIEVLAGLVEPAQLSGTVEFDGADITRLSARRRKELGLAHIPEDRHRRGLLLDADLLENSILGVHFREPAVKPPARIMLDPIGIRRRTAELLRDFDVRPAQPDLPARSLSGGNQQKLVIGREFGLPPRLLLVAQPTRGVDIGAIEFIHRKLIALRDSGCAVLLVSAELEEVTALADRLLVIYHGKIAGEVEPAHAAIEDIGLMMTGGRA